MRLFLLALILSISTVFSQTDNNSPEPIRTLEIIGSKIENKEYDQAKEFLIDKGLSNEKLEDLKVVIGKVLQYIESGITVPTKEGSRQYSIDLRNSVIFLLKEKNKLYLTKGTTSNIDKLLADAELLNTPEKTMSYFIDRVKKGDLNDAYTCFVKKDKSTLDENAAKHFAEMLEYILSKSIPGNYQGVEQDSLVSYPFIDKSISLALENGDWLFTISTQDNIPYLYREFKEKNINSLIPAWLDNKILLLKNWQWLGIIVILIIGVIIQWLFKVMIKKAVIGKLEFVEKKEEPQKFRSITILCVSLCWYFLFPVLAIDKDVAGILRNAAGIMAMVSALFVVSRLLDFFKELMMQKAESTDNKVDDVLIPMFHKLVKLATLVVGVVLIASNIGINVASLLAGIGLVGMALALAAKDTVENIFGSITVLLDKPFEVGDFISINGIDGIVEQIGLRSTRIRTFYRSQVNVPNSTLIKATVDNYGRRNCRRIKTVLSLTYDTPPDKIEAFCEGIRELVRNHPFTLKDNYHVYFTEFNSASLDVLLLCYIDTGDYAIELRERQRLFTDIIRLAGRLEVEFAFPTQTIHMAKPEDLYDAEKETDIKKINDAILSGKKLGSKIISESLPEKSQLPPEVDYINGNSYYVEKPKK